MTCSVDSGTEGFSFKQRNTAIQCLIDELGCLAKDTGNVGP